MSSADSGLVASPVNEPIPYNMYKGPVPIPGPVTVAGVTECADWLAELGRVSFLRSTVRMAPLEPHELRERERERERNDPQRRARALYPKTERDGDGQRQVATTGPCSSCLN